jgi:RND family efflux transporter MFP subunit
MNSNKKWMGSAGLTAAVSLAIAAVVVGANDPKTAAINSGSPAAATAARPALTVTVTQATKSIWPTTLTANGTIAAWQEAAVGAESNGLRLNDVRVNVGDVVKRGQVLATFSAETIQAELAQQSAMTAEAEAALAEAQANAARARTLQDSGALPTQQINQYLTAEKTAQFRLNAARAAEQSIKLRLGFTRVIAPDDGVISGRSATVGAVVNGGQELFRLIRKNRLEWRGEMAASDLANVQAGQSVALTLPDSTAASGKVRMIAPTVDAQSRNGLVYVDLAPNPRAKAGMYARGDFTVGSTTALTVPHSALVLRDGFQYILKLEAGNKVSAKRVQIGRRVGDRVEILDGISPDEKLIASGGAFLSDGDLVRVVQ